MGAATSPSPTPTPQPAAAPAPQEDLRVEQTAISEKRAKKERGPVAKIPFSSYLVAGRIDHGGGFFSGEAGQRTTRQRRAEIVLVIAVTVIIMIIIMTRDRARATAER
jgi:hypothetical protein